jgi:methylmalonyl-CoA mutase N-terminal domain/subunit
VYDAAGAKAQAIRAARWAQSTLGASLEKLPLRRQSWTTDSGVPIPELLTAADRRDERAEALGLPGEFPYTRGTQADDVPQPPVDDAPVRGLRHARRHEQAVQVPDRNGVTGLSTAFDMPALMGYDADHELSRGEVGKEGVAVSTLKDFEILFDGIALDQVTTSMTINASAIVALAMYIAVAEKQGVPMAKLGGTIQNDMLKEFIAQKEWIVGRARRCASSPT